MIITSMDALDVAFVENLFGCSGDVRAVQVSRIGTGQVALSLKVDIEWAPNAVGRHPEVLVVKIPAAEIESREAARMMRTYHLEVGFYRDIADRVAIPHPTALLAEIEPESGDFTLVMTPALGTVGDQLAGCGVREAGAMVDAAVGLHAPTWDQVAELGTLPWLGVPDPAGIAMRVGAYQHLLSGFRDRFATRLDDAALEAADWLGANLAAVIAAYRSPLCLVHGDYRLDNMLFASGADAVHVTVLDWQTLAFGRGAADVAYAVGSGLVAAERRRSESELVDRYVAGLEQAGIGAVGDNVRHDYRLGTVTGLAMAVIASQLVTATERGDEMFAVMAERHALQMIDNDVFALV